MRKSRRSRTARTSRSLKDKSYSSTGRVSALPKAWNKKELPPPARTPLTLTTRGEFLPEPNTSTLFRRPYTARVGSNRSGNGKYSNEQQQQQQQNTQPQYTPHQPLSRNTGRSVRTAMFFRHSPPPSPINVSPRVVRQSLASSMGQHQQQHSRDNITSSSSFYTPNHAPVANVNSPQRPQTSQPSSASHFFNQTRQIPSSPRVTRAERQSCPTGNRRDTEQFFMTGGGACVSFAEPGSLISEESDSEFSNAYSKEEKSLQSVDIEAELFNNLEQQSSSTYKPSESVMSQKAKANRLGPIRNVYGHSTSADISCVISCGILCASGDSNGRVLLFEKESGSVKTSFNFNTPNDTNAISVESIVLSGGGSVLVGTSNGTITALCSSTLRPVHPQQYYSQLCSALDGIHSVTAMCVSEDDSLLLVGDDDGYLTMFALHEVRLHHPLHITRQKRWNISSSRISKISVIPTNDDQEQLFMVIVNGRSVGIWDDAGNHRAWVGQSDWTPLTTLSSDESDMSNFDSSSSDDDGLDAHTINTEDLTTLDPADTDLTEEDMLKDFEKRLPPSKPKCMQSFGLRSEGMFAKKSKTSQTVNVNKNDKSLDDIVLSSAALNLHKKLDRQVDALERRRQRNTGKAGSVYTSYTRNQRLSSANTVNSNSRK
eukprot:TRINITY_DN988_c0_g1_i5.p1 TRINITY_DN988_c0_g1~~TRINITY_DN988_c0_g1_i5.p1  ORF type:complete len:656 (-),score=195.47 TRINITY_DN988_c0_g1_i5:278-2245(-)